MPEKIFVGIVACCDARSLFVESVNSLVERIIAIMADENATRGELLVAVATEGAAAVFAIFAGLLVTFIGEPLTTGLLQKAWPNAFSDTHAEER